MAYNLDKPYKWPKTDGYKTTREMLSTEEGRGKLRWVIKQPFSGEAKFKAWHDSKVDTIKKELANFNDDLQVTGGKENPIVNTEPTKSLETNKIQLELDVINGKLDKILSYLKPKVSPNDELEAVTYDIEDVEF